MNEYNGWKNYQTWNVALWIGNDEGLYNAALNSESYEDFVAWCVDIGMNQTPDGVAWNDSGLDTDALNEMINEFKS